MLLDLTTNTKKIKFYDKLDKFLKIISNMGHPIHEYFEMGVLFVKKRSICVKIEQILLNNDYCWESQQDNDNLEERYRKLDEIQHAEDYNRILYFNIRFKEKIIRYDTMTFQYSSTAITDLDSYINEFFKNGELNVT